MSSSQPTGIESVNKNFQELSRIVGERNVRGINEILQNTLQEIRGQAAPQGQDPFSQNANSILKQIQDQTSNLQGKEQIELALKSINGAINQIGAMRTSKLDAEGHSGTGNQSRPPSR